MPKKRAAKSKFAEYLKVVEAYQDLVDKVPELINESPLLKATIAKKMKLDYVTFWRKLNTQKLSVDQITQLLLILSAGETKTKK